MLLPPAPGLHSELTMPLPYDPSQGPPKLDPPRMAIVRESLPVAPERAFELFTRSEELKRWFCHEADVQEIHGGEVHVTWMDEDGEPWDRVGRWIAFEPPHLAVLEWFDVQTAAEPEQGEAEAQEKPRDVLRVAIAAEEEGCMVTVMSPLLQSQLRADVALDAVRHGWRMAFAELRELLQLPPQP